MERQLGLGPRLLSEFFGFIYALFGYILVNNMRVELIAVSKPLVGDGDSRRLVELAVKTSSGKVRKKGPNGHYHYLTAERGEDELNKWLINASEKFPSVLEHIVFTFYIDGISRVASHQLVRHRIASYTQESLRYSKLSDPDKILSDLEEMQACLNGLKECSLEDMKDKLSRYFVLPNEFDPTMFIASLRTYAYLLLDGVSYEDARYVLPMATKTRMIMTVNLRELLHIGCMRIRDEAQAETRMLVEIMFVEVERKTGIPIWKMWSKYCRGEK